MATLAATYLRYDTFEPPRGGEREVVARLREAGRRAAEEAFLRPALGEFPGYDGLPTVDAEVELGSLRAWVKAVAWLGPALYVAIGNYGDFWDGVDRITAQATSFGDYIQHIVPHELGVREYPDSIRRHTGVPGQIQRLGRELSDLGVTWSSLSPAELHERIHGVQKRLRRIMNQLAPEERELLLRALAERRERAHPRHVPDYVWERMPFLDEATRRGRAGISLSSDLPRFPSFGPPIPR